MLGSNRLARLQRKLEALESEYRQKLIVALQICSDGKWGLFGQNDAALADEPRALRERLKSEEAETLMKLGSEISDLRQRLGITEAFPLHERFVQTRTSTDPNVPGEPRLARTWLDELAADQ